MSLNLLIAQTSGVGPWVVLGFFGLFLLIAVIAFIAKITVVGTPSELLVVSGKKSARGQNFKAFIGGRTYVIPVWQKVDRLSLRNMQVSLEVRAQAGAGTMIPVTLTGVANVKVSSEPGVRDNAIERFLGQSSADLQRVARETLEGGIRAVIGKITPEEIVEDRDKFVSTVMNEVTDDFRKLGLIIDSVNIQNIHDDEHYLESIARKASAQVRADARKFEAQRTAEADIKEAEADAQARQARAQRDAEAKTAEAKGHQKAEEARLGAEKAIAEANNALRIRKAELAKEAAIKEAETQEAAARAEEQRLIATDVTRAEAARDVAKATAEGEAALILEQGKSRAAALEQIGRAIQQHPDALKVMLTEMLPGIVHEIMQTVSGVNLGDVTVIDSGNGQAIAGAAMGRARMLSESLATLESVLGIDLKDLTHSIAANITNGKGQASPVASGVTSGASV